MKSEHISVSFDMTTICITKENRAVLQSLKRGNPDRNKGMDTYDDVLERLFKLVDI